MVTFHLWQKTSKKLCESCTMSVSTTRSNQCPWPYLTELRPSWQAGRPCPGRPIMPLPAGWGSACRGAWTDPHQSLLRTYPTFIKADPQPSGQPCHTAATVRTTPEVTVNSGEFVLVASCCDFPVIPKEIKSVQAWSDLLTSRSVDTQFARRSTFL